MNTYLHALGLILTFSLTLILMAPPQRAWAQAHKTSDGPQDYELFLVVQGTDDVTVTVSEVNGSWSRSVIVNANTNTFSQGGLDWVADTDAGVPTDTSSFRWDLDGNTLYKIQFTKNGTTTTYYHFNCNTGGNTLANGFYCVGGEFGINDLYFEDVGNTVHVWDDTFHPTYSSFNSFFSNNNWVIPHQYLRQF